MKRSTIAKLIVAAVLVCVMIFLPEVVSAGWHAANGRAVTFRVWKVTVPFEWFARRQGEDMVLERMLRLSWQKAPNAIFEPVHFTKTYPFQYSVFGQQQERVMRARGYVLRDTRDFAVGSQSGKCWIFGMWNDASQEWISCIVPKDLTSVDYMGPHSYERDFFALLKNVQPAPAK